jgi:signal transduction histidine kinase
MAVQSSRFILECMFFFSLTWKRSIFFLLVFMGYVDLHAQKPVGQPQNREQLNITGSSQYLLQKDRSDPSTVYLSTDWKQLSGKFTFQTNPGNRWVWLKFIVNTHAVKGRKIWLKLSNKGINELELFRKSDTGFLSLGLTGDHFPFHHRPHESRYFIYPISTQSALPDTYLLRLDKRHENLNAQIHLLSDDQLQKIENRANVFTGLFAGILLFAFASTIFLFAVFRDRLQIWYAGYILSILYLILAYEGFDFEFLYPEKPFFADVSRYLSSITTLVLMTTVMQHYCKQTRSNSKFFFMLNLNKWFTFLLFPLTLILYRYYPIPELKPIHFWVFLLTQILGILLIMASCIEKIFQRYRPAYFYFAAVSLLLVNSIQAIFFETGKLNGSAETPNFLQWSIILEVVLISIGILYRYHLIQQKNEALINEMNELKVNSVKRILEARQSEQQRIAEDLHDLFGGHLAAIKLKISQWLHNNPAHDDIIKAVDQLSTQTREIAHDLTPTPLHQHDLSDIVESLIQQLNREQKIRFRFFQTGEPRAFSKEDEINLYKIVLEIIHNILKHSKATEAFIQFFFRQEAFELVAEDNGVGIDAEKPLGMGIQNIRRRISKMKGNCHIDSSKGHTTIIIQLPI